MFQEDVGAAIGQWNRIYDARVRAVISDRDAGPWEFDVSRYAAQGRVDGCAGSAVSSSVPASSAPSLGLSVGRNVGQMIGHGSGM